MNVQIRVLKSEDISAVAELERQAFPTLWPPTPFKREVENSLAKYLVATVPKAVDGSHRNGPNPGKSVKPSTASLLANLFGMLKGRLYSTKAPTQQGSHLLGFVGLWFMAGEAHITGIAVEQESRGKGIGELLLMGSIELAMRRRAREVSLEARISNHVAQSLYEKYGFQTVGIRKGYYTDNREDAVIMTTQAISTAAYQDRLQALREAYTRRYGEIRIVLT